MSTEGLFLIGAGVSTAYVSSLPVIAVLGGLAWLIVGWIRRAQQESDRAEDARWRLDPSCSARLDPCRRMAQAVLTQIRESPAEVRDLLGEIEKQVRALWAKALGLSREAARKEHFDAQLAAIQAALERTRVTVSRVCASAECDTLADALEALGREVDAIDRVVDEVYGAKERR